MGPKNKNQTNSTRKNNKANTNISVTNNNAIIPVVDVPGLSGEDLSSNNNEPIALNVENVSEPVVPIPAQNTSNKTVKKRSKYCPRGSRRIKGVCVRTIDGVVVPEIGEDDEPQIVPTENVIVRTPVLQSSVGVQGITGKDLSSKVIKNKEPRSNQQIQPVDEVTDDIQCKNKRSGMNAFLAEKERMEYAEHKRDTLSQDDPLNTLYPDLNDPNFHLRIADRKEFQETKYDDAIYDIRAQSDIMCDAKFELMPHQLFVKNFLSMQTPYNSLLLYHGLGTGKTCTAIGVGEETRKYMAQMGIREKILIVASPNVQANFRTQLFNESKLVQIFHPTNPAEFTWNIETCVGESLLKEIDPNGVRNVPRERIVSNIQAIISTWYEFMGYGQLANYITNHTKITNPTAYTIEERKQIELRKIRSAFNNKTVIVDEVHNITQTTDNKHQTTGALLLRVAKYAVNMRLLLLSATPMFDTYKEIVWIANLLNTNDKRSQIDIGDVFDPNGNFKEVSGKDSCGVPKENGKDLLMRKLTGYISYVRGENPYTFPFRVYPDIFAPEKTFSSGIPYPTTQMNNVPVSNPLTHIKIYLNEIASDTYQYRAYKHIVSTIRRSVVADNGDANQFIMLQKPVECLNIVYPNDHFERMLNSPNPNEATTVIPANIIGESGFNSIMVYKEKGALQSPKFDYKPRVVEKYGRVFSPGVLPKYSKKMSNICDIIRNTEGIVLIYSQYIDGGVVPMALALEEMGFAKYSGNANTNSSLFRNTPCEPIDAVTMRTRSQVPRETFRQANYIMITGNKMYSPNNAVEIDYTKLPENSDGSRVKVILISKAGSEGLDFKHIRQIHILEPWFNMNRIEQIIGRGVRNLSHCGLPFEQRNVQIYLHGTIFEAGDTEEPVDLYIYRIAEKKALQIGKVTRLLKTISVDCVLNIGQTNMTAEKLLSRVENQKIEVRLATKNQVTLRVGDQPYTDICDYMDTCEYTCRNYTSENGENSKENESNTLINNTITTTYSTKFAESNIYAISKRIRDLFREQSVYKRDQLITSINIRKKYPLEHIFYALSVFIENEYEYLVDKYERNGHLVNNGEYYAFQPIEISDDQTTTFERSVPVQYARTGFSLELPKQVTAIRPDAVKANTIAPLPNAPRVDEIAETSQVEIVDNEPFVDVNETDAINTLKQIQTLYNKTNDPDAKKPPLLKLDKTWYENCAYVKDKLMSKYGMTSEHLMGYIISHILDEMNHPEKLAVFMYLYGASKPNISPEFEQPLVNTIMAYFEGRMFRNAPHNKWGILLVDNAKVELYIRSLDDSRPEWNIAELSEYKYFKEDIAKHMIVDKTRLNRVIGYIIMFKTIKMTFKYKDITHTRNKLGARCDSAGKQDIIDMLNKLIGRETYTNANTEGKLLHPHLCVILEMLLRDYTRGRKDGKIYYLTPEQSILNEITKYSTG